jgi:hypothetical protein
MIAKACGRAVEPPKAKSGGSDGAGATARVGLERPERQGKSGDSVDPVTNARPEKSRAIPGTLARPQPKVPAGSGTSPKWALICGIGARISSRLPTHPQADSKGRHRRPSGGRSGGCRKTTHCLGDDTASTGDATRPFEERPGTTTRTYPRAGQCAPPNIPSCRSTYPGKSPGRSPLLRWG